MNVYEEAHNLAQAVKESEEYKQFRYLSSVVEQKPELAEKLKEFQRLQTEQQAKQLTGEQISQEVLQQVQEMYQILAADPSAAQYLQAAARFSLMMSDVAKILGDAIDIGNMLKF